MPEIRAAKNSNQIPGTTGDKVARALVVQPILSNGIVYAPVRDWSESLITQASVLPKGKHDDMVDSMTMALKYLRDVGIVQNVEEVLAEENERVVPRSRPEVVSVFCTGR
jgi:phage terminase large subunit-like protein